jgi:hypothetical protein
MVNELTNAKTDINEATIDTLRDRYDAAGNVKVAASAPSPGSRPPATP